VEKASKARRTYFDKTSDIKKHLNQYFPNRHTHYATDPFDQAIKHKGAALARSSILAPKRYISWSEEGT
jgi:hypothetical protein